MYRRLSILIAIAALLQFAPLAAQSTVATVTGIVTDAENALVPGVAVTIRNVDTIARPAKGILRQKVTKGPGTSPPAARAEAHPV